MNSEEMENKLRQELQSGKSFSNSHGITPANVSQFFVSPYSVLCNPDDLETRPRDMWVVLEEKRKDGYVILYDPQTNRWGVGEREGSNQFVLVVSANSFAEALEAM